MSSLRWATGILLYLVIHAEAQGPSCGAADTQLARYFYELLNNRADGCLPGANFITTPAADDVKLTYPEWCTEDKGNGVTDVNATFSFLQCDGGSGDGKLTTLAVKARVLQCTASTSILLQPSSTINVLKSETMPSNFTCPTGFTTYEGDFGDVDFTERWEFAHLAENAFKYNLSQTDVGRDLVTCNSYLDTTITRGCVNPNTRRYFGYASVRAECYSDYKRVVDVPLFVDAQLEARAACPWPEFLKGSPGYNANYTFTAQSTANISPSIVSPAPSPSPSPGVLVAALQCLTDNEIEFVDAADGAQYQEAKLVWNKVMTTAKPFAIATPKTTQQVQSAVQCLQENGIAAVPRSGGHSYQGYSVLNNAVTIDLKHLNSTTFSADKTQITIGAGMKLGPLYYTVVTQAPGKVFPAGTCPPVGVGGLITGGGIGYLTRAHGLSCDLLVSLTMVDASGQIITASATENVDLFWASCGGGGGNFGIITDYTVKLMDVPTANVIKFGFTVEENGVDFIMYVQDTVAKIADPALGIVMYPGESKEARSVDVNCLYSGGGSLSDLEKVLESSGLGAVNLTDNNFNVVNAFRREMPFLDFVVEEAYMEGIVDAPSDLINNVEIYDQGRVFFKYKSLYILPEGPTLLPKAAYEAIITWKRTTQAAMEANEDYDSYAGAELTLLGPKSAVATRASNSTAYPYRNAIYLLQYGIEWMDGEFSTEYSAFVDQLQTTLSGFTGTMNSAGYVNYLDNSVSLESFYGANFDRLKQVKSEVDPNNYFRNPFSVPLSTAVTPFGPVTSPSSNTTTSPVPSPSSSPAGTNTGTTSPPSVVPPSPPPPSSAGMASQMKIAVAGCVMVIMCGGWFV